MSKNGMKGWPFQIVKKNKYHLTWFDITETREQILRGNPVEEIYDALTKAKSTGWLMRRIHDDSFTNTKESYCLLSGALPLDPLVSDPLVSDPLVSDTLVSDPLQLDPLPSSNEDISNMVESVASSDYISDWSFLDEIINDESVRSQLETIAQEPVENYWDGLFD